MKIWKGVLIHICVVCSLVGIIARILDWYNPFMDFSGHMYFVQLLLYVSVIFAAFTRRKRGK